jgi:hypothetical protein
MKIIASGILQIFKKSGQPQGIAPTFNDGL